MSDGRGMRLGAFVPSFLFLPAACSTSAVVQASQTFLQGYDSLSTAREQGLDRWDSIVAGGLELKGRCEE